MGGAEMTPTAHHYVEWFVRDVARCQFVAYESNRAVFVMHFNEASENVTSLDDILTDAGGLLDSEAQELLRGIWR
jgi:hypothetical protein